MALNITINKKAVATSYPAGSTVATAVASGGTTPYTYSLATGGNYFSINASTGVVTTKALMDADSIQSFSVTATDSNSTPESITSGVVYPNIQAAIQNKFSKSNMIYKITKDIDLGNGILTIPDNCTLDFQGGSFSNGTIVGSNTKINAGLQKIFNTDIIISGTWSIVESYPEWFGAKGDGNTDDRIPVQKVIDSFDNILLSSKTYLLNSYTTDETSIHSIILKLRSNITIKGSYGVSTLKIGRFFDDKNFLVLSGFNAVNPTDFTNIYNISISNIVFDFNSSYVNMKTKYSRCIGIEFGQVFNSIVENCIFTNGDLVQAISVGWNGIADNCIINNCSFINLIVERPYNPDGYETNNKDHSTIYTDCTNVLISNNLFSNSSKHARRIACAGEFHRSKVRFIGNDVVGYARGHLIAPTTATENTLQDILINGNRYNVVNCIVHLWNTANYTISGVYLTNNEGELNHIKGDGTLWSNGAQKVLTTTADDNKTGAINGLYIEGNIFKIGYTIPDQTALGDRTICNLGISTAPISNINIINNHFMEFDYGIQISKDVAVSNINIIGNNCIIKRFNNITPTNYITIATTGLNLSDINIKGNFINYNSLVTSPAHLVNLEGATLLRCNIDNKGLCRGATTIVTSSTSTFDTCYIKSCVKEKVTIPANESAIDSVTKIAHTFKTVDNYNSSVVITYCRNNYYGIENAVPFVWSGSGFLNFKKYNTVTTDTIAYIVYDSILESTNNFSDN